MSTDDGEIGRLEASRVVVGVVSRYNASVTEPMWEGAEREFGARAPAGCSLVRIDAPGTFELPQIAMAAARRPECVGVLTLGCVIKGETRHDRYISQSVADAIQRVSESTGKPVAFGVLTTEDAAQAHARAGGAMGNKGEEAMGALLDSISAFEIVSRGLGGEVVSVDRPDKAAGVARGRGA